MEDIKKQAKLSVLKELIDMMKEKELTDFKGKSSKFSPKEDKHPEEMMVVLEEDPEELEIDDSEESEDDEDMQRLKEMYARLK